MSKQILLHTGKTHRTATQSLVPKEKSPLKRGLFGGGRFVMLNQAVKVVILFGPGPAICCIPAEPGQRSF